MFYNNFQNTVTPANTNVNPYNDQYFGRNDQVPYIQGVTAMPPMSSPVPLQPSTATPYLSNNNYSFAEGGKVRKTPTRNNPYPDLAEMIRQQGTGEDVILAHINPLEAQMLGALSGGGKINKKTGLPQFGFFNNPKKWFKGSAGPILGALIGNMVLPGIGGIVGGGLGGAAGSTIRGRKDYGQAALRGASLGATLPLMTSLAGQGINAIAGNNQAANKLMNYGETNSILKAFGMGDTLSPVVSDNNLVNNAASKGALQNSAASKGMLDRLGSNTKEYLTKPQNLLNLAAVASSMHNRPKPPREKTPEELAQEKKRLDKALQLTPEERQAHEAQLIAEAQMQRRVRNNSFLPEDRLGDIGSSYVRSYSPEEHQRVNRWVDYYEMPRYKTGGLIEHLLNHEVRGQYPSGLIEGVGGGQDDDVRTYLPEDSYIIDASTVADLGDGNTHAGARKIDALVSNGEYFVSPDKVRKLGGGNSEHGSALLNKLVKNVRRHKGGSIKLPPKSKPITSYIGGK